MLKSESMSKTVEHCSVRGCGKAAIAVEDGKLYCAEHGLEAAKMDQRVRAAR